MTGRTSGIQKYMYVFKKSVIFGKITILLKKKLQKS